MKDLSTSSSNKASLVRSENLVLTGTAQPLHPWVAAESLDSYLDCDSFRLLYKVDILTMSCYGLKLSKKRVKSSTDSSFYFH